MMAADAYLFGYRQGEISVETYNADGVEVPAEIEDALASAIDEVERADILDAYHNGVMTAIYKQEPMTRAQAEIAYD